MAKTDGRFVKGISGNPGGRKRGAERTFREVAEQRVYVAADGVEYRGIHALAHVLLDIAYSKDEQARDRARAVEMFIDRGWGKVKDTVVVESSETPTVDWRSVPMKDREEILGAICKLQEIVGDGAPDSPTEH